MVRISRSLVLGLLLSSTSLSTFAHPVSPGSPSHRQKFSLNLDWSFHRGELSALPIAADVSHEGWADAVVPHTYQLTSINLDDSEDSRDQLTFHRDVSWYRRQIQRDFDPGQRVFLEFEGAHQRSELWVNGTRVGEHATSAYTPFHFDITDHVRPGESNTIALRLDNRKTSEIPPDGHIWDYVLFGGLYRDVYLVITNPVHIPFKWDSPDGGVVVRTPSVNQKAGTVSVRTTIRNSSAEAQEGLVETRVLNADNEVVLKLTKSVHLPAHTDRSVVQTGGIDKDLRLWSLSDPYLYRVNTQIVVDGITVDHTDNPLGFRWFEHRLGEGMLLNGEPIKLWGANRHQQYPYIGDAMPNNLHRADAIKLKEIGMNIVRLAHYPHDDAFLQACDELGILVCEEPPSWIEAGSPLWMDRLEESFRITIRNHRNHPSVWGWGAGINHRGPVQRLHYAAKEEDPTRVTMNNGTTWTGPQHSGVTDIYAVMDYGGVTRPENELLFAMEHSGSVDTLKTQAFVSRYNADSNLLGGALWSAHDNYSFKKRDGRNPALSEWSAAPWDVFRQPKPNYHWFRSELTTEPMVHIADSRAQKEGSVTIFTNCDEVELLIDGVSQGTQRPSPDADRAHLNSPSIAFPVTWSAGEVTVHGLINGVVVVSDSRHQAGPAHHLTLEFDTTGYDFAADGSSIVPAYAWVRDEYGAIVTTNAPEVTFTIDGPGEIIGDASIQANPVTWENGYAPVLVRVSRDPGKIRLNASSPHLKSAQTTLSTGPWSDDWFVQHARPIHEPLRLRVDLGNIHQHVEDEWSPWHGGIWDGQTRDLQDSWTDWSDTVSASDQATFTTSSGHEVGVTLSVDTSTLGWTRSWGVPGDLSFMIEDAAVTSATNALQLIINPLPAGHYRLKTWHHLITKDRDQAPAISLRVTDAQYPNHLRHEKFRPSYGGLIKVSQAGVGGAGDGGSNLGAGRFLLTEFESDGQSPITLTITSESSEGSIALSGFDLKQVFLP